MTFMLTGVISCSTGITKAPPLIDDLLAEKTGADEGDFLRGAAVEPAQDVDRDYDDDGEMMIASRRLPKVCAAISRSSQ